MARPSTCWASRREFCLPCPFGNILTDDFETGITIPLPRDPELGSGDRLRQMQQLGVATKIQKHAHLPGLRFFGHFEDQPAVRRMDAHDDGNEDHPVRRKVALMQSEGGRCRLGRVDPGRLLLHQTADAVRALPSGKLLGEACGRFGAAIGVMSTAASTRWAAIHILTPR